MHEPTNHSADCDVKAEICLHENLFTDSRSLQIYCNFSQENPKITSISNPHRGYMHFDKRLAIVEVLFLDGQREF